MTPDRPFPKLAFLDEGHPADPAELSNLEKRLGTPLPPFLKAWLEKYSGSMLDRSNNWIPRYAIEGLPCSVGIEYVLDVNGIQEELDLYSEAFTSGHVPFCHDGDGNYILVAEDGSVSFWDYRGRISQSAKGSIDRYTIRVAETIPDFLSRLGPGPTFEE